MKRKDKRPLQEKFPPSDPCCCDICKSYCKRPGWWTVEEAELAIESGYAGRMMLEMSPEFTFGVLSPAFKGCEKNYAIHEYANNGCTFFHNGLCELHSAGLEPLECRFCHHSRIGQGIKCHTAIERDWQSERGRLLVTKWLNITGLNYRYKLIK